MAKLTRKSMKYMGIKTDSRNNVSRADTMLLERIDKYIPRVHTQTDVDYGNGILGIKSFISSFKHFEDDGESSYAKELSRHQAAVENILAISETNMEKLETIFQRLYEISKEIRDEL